MRFELGGSISYQMANGLVSTRKRDGQNENEKKSSEISLDPSKISPNLMRSC